MRKTVAFGFVGTVLDYAGRGSQRWEKWRPTLYLCQQETLVVHRLELLYDARSRSLFEGLKKDIASVSPETEVVGVEIAIRNPCFNRMIEQIERVAIRSRSPILLNGPTGAGKSFLARRIYELKLARHQFSGPFVEVNCATLRGDTAMSALFGHVKGAFTGAREERAGLLRSADGGMLFLDEVGELGADEQAMLLKAIEEKRFYPFGSDQQVSSDFQLIAGTVRDLRQRVAEGTFREDLYARINLWTFELPGLRQRQEDIEPNLDYELERHAALTGDSVRFNTEARRAWLSFATSPQAAWRGNFRELSALDGLPGIDATALDLFDRMQLENVVAVCRQAKTLSDAGRQLFNVSRQGKATVNDADRLRKYLARFGLTWDVLQN
ncbi:Transcriptional regulatory protein QseF [Salmonella enterica subsp. enterica serovar Typhisuis]|uniref:AAA family ATPase n=1 Tax=Salmonella enterica TaxID=28901 RepID=A0A749KPW8_SALER|nr:AAA family ATPase [Salmonella enterica subsp. enterica serovar Typhisuis]HAF2716988.1 AAA family ATPase [Salmonella enterica]EAV9427431.1 AAA family ATPase [Salmonella enterica subsp. enterica serovar Typhisuis]EBY9896674.1 AAA family ATPase [Salmonella enterica subsp. enterica serovar Typhisuis]ECG2223129.1 AAA family ATPase [Salmonella enterica subsp. enterica serovar Typhisuis]